MKNICFVGCTKSKQNYECSAKEMYSKSVYFNKQLKYIDFMYNCEYYILSAKYGLLSPDTKIQPYDLSLNYMSTEEYNKWVDIVSKEIIENIDINNVNAIFLCGKKYRGKLMNLFKNYEEPFKSLGIGQQMKKMNKVI